jgi:hypothetical protein
MIHRRFSLQAVLAACVPFVTAGALGCSSSTDAEPSEARRSTFCSSEENVAPEFAMPMIEMGDQQLFEVSIVKADPPAPAQGSNVWTVQVNDAAGDPVEDAELTVKCSMPGHNHGCAVRPTVTNLGDGKYQFDPLIFTMSKNWNVTFTVQGVDGTSDFARFSLCI